MCLACLVACGSHSEKTTATGPIKRYQMRGQIIQLDTINHTATIQHEKIDGWMEAMTMEYPVKDSDEFQKLTAGDRITATVFVQGMDYWVGEIHHEYGK
jgi:Cu/Ag efflux protein CusF